MAPSRRGCVAVVFLAATPAAPARPRPVDPLRRCFSVKDFAKAVSQDRYPLPRGLGNGTASSPLGCGRLAVVVRGHLFHAEYYTRSTWSVRRRDATYDIDVRRTLPSFLAEVVEPLRRQGVTVDLYFASATPRWSDERVARVAAEVRDAHRPEAMWMFPANESTSQFRYVSEALRRVQARAARLSLRYDCLLLVRGDLLWMPTALPILLSNYDGRAVNVLSYIPGTSEEGDAMDVLHVVPWNLVGNFTQAVHVAKWRHLHNIARLVAIVPLVQGCLCPNDCNLMVQTYRGNHTSPDCLSRARKVHGAFLRTGRLNHSALALGLATSPSRLKPWASARQMFHRKSLAYSCNPFRRRAR